MSREKEKDQMGATTKHKRENIEAPNGAAAHVPPSKWRQVAVDVLGSAPAWDWNADGPVIVGVLLDARDVATHYEGRARQRSRAIVECHDSLTGEVTRRAVFLPVEYGAALARLARRWVRVSREGEGLDSRYNLETQA